MFECEIFSHKLWLKDRHEISSRVSDFRLEVEAEHWEWAKSRRMEYLTERLKSLVVSLSRGRIAAGRLMLRANKKELPFLTELFREDPEIPAIKKINNEIKYKWDRPEGLKNAITPDQVDRAREYPLWKWLGKKPNERIACPFHMGQDKNFGFKAEIGHCFVCGKSVNTIGWLMEINQMRFYQAVKELQ